MNLLAIVLVAVAAASAAPADQYFGKLKMSTLRIRYEAMQVKSHYESHKLLPEEAEHLAELTQNAFDDWAAKYPHDSWLASTAYLQAGLYLELPGAAARGRAEQLLRFITSHFPQSTYAGEGRTLLHRGLPVRADPGWAVAMRTARAASPSPVPSTAAVPSPVATPTASPTPARE